jgi:hypothetical protein
MGVWNSSSWVWNGCIYTMDVTVRSVTLTLRYFWIRRNLCGIVPRRLFGHGGSRFRTPTALAPTITGVVLMIVWYFFFGSLYLALSPFLSAEKG